MRALYDVPAPAKLNLFLHITGRRADGYHLLQSVFMLIDWCDTLHFELRSGGSISRQDLGAPLPDDDLILRAARALQAATGCTQGVHITIDKRIPTQAGMGGGSSDAASTLLALNRLWGLNLRAHALAEIGLTLGADVPFFLCGSHAWVQGIGEHISPMKLPPAHFVVAKPPQGLDTSAIFRASTLKRDCKHAILAGFVAHPYHFGQNVLQPVAQGLCPQVTEGLELLAQHGLSGKMTGSGSAVFAHLPSGAGAFRTPSGWPPDWQVRVCSNLDAHPLSGWAPGDN